MPMIPLRILLINTNVPKNTKIQVENVKKIATSSPNVSKHIFEAMDEVAIECLDTLALLSTSRPESEDSGIHIQNTKEKCKNNKQCIGVYQKTCNDDEDAYQCVKNQTSASHVQDEGCLYRKIGIGT